MYCDYYWLHTTNDDISVSSLGRNMKLNQIVKQNVMFRLLHDVHFSKTACLNVQFKSWDLNIDFKFKCFCSLKKN